MPAGKPVLPVAAEHEQPAGGAGGADGGLHRFGLHQPRAAAGHPEPVRAGATGHPAAGAHLDRSGESARAEGASADAQAPAGIFIKKTHTHTYVTM